MGGGAAKASFLRRGGGNGDLHPFAACLANLLPGHTFACVKWGLWQFKHLAVARSAPVPRALLNWAVVVAGGVLICAEFTVGIPGVMGLNVSPSAATAAKRVRALFHEVLDSASEAQEPQSALLEAAKSRLSQD